MSEKPAARLYVPDDLGPGLSLALAESQAHYLRSVLRLAPGAILALFNGRDGEWRGRVGGLAPGRGSGGPPGRAPPPGPGPPLLLGFPPPPRGRPAHLPPRAPPPAAPPRHPPPTP